MDTGLLPTVKGILILDEDGTRISAKYYDKINFCSHTSQTEFEQKLCRKIKGTTAKNEADIIILDNLIVVFRAGADLNFCIIGSSTENELILTSVLDGFYDAVSQLLRGQLDRHTVLDNMALVLLAQDELVDAGYLLEINADNIASRVLMRGASVSTQGSSASGGGSVPFSELTITSALQTAKEELIKRMAN